MKTTEIQKRGPALLLTLALLGLFAGGCAPKTGNSASSGTFTTDCPAEATEAPAQTLYIGRTAPDIPKAEEVTPTAGEFSVSRAFGKNMVLQRDDYIRIWGTAEGQDGKTVCAEFKGLKGSATVENGRFLITLDGTLAASAETGHSLRVYSATQEKVFTDVLVGDVYLVLGQSNAAYTVSNHLGDVKNDDEFNQDFTAKDITNSDNIRIIRNGLGDPMTKGDPTSELAEDVQHKRGWQMPKSGAPASSAIGYFFAKQLIAQTNNEIPIGLIECTASGYQLAAFLSAEAAEACGADSYDQKKGGYYSNSVNGMLQSRFMFNQYIYPFLHFTFSGILWYQGESDAPASLAGQYAENFAVMIRDYRDKIDQHYRDFPVYIIELPPEYRAPAGWDSKKAWAYINVGSVRSYMGNIPGMLPNAFPVSTSDLWKKTDYWNSLHPYCKWPMAKRAAALAMTILYRDYSDSKMEYVCAPFFRECVSFSGQEAVLRFACVGDGLTLAGETARGFEVYVGEEWVAPDSVQVSGDTVTVSHSAAFSRVRYNGSTSFSYPETVNAGSSTGIPMTAFCWEAAEG